ncbi:MAG: hypothetical protein Solivirus5_1, partial [Solivirus sp.]
FTKFVEPKVEPKVEEKRVSPQIPFRSYYSRISSLPEEKREENLILYGKEARRIIPTFPQFVPGREFSKDSTAAKLNIKESTLKYLGQLFPGIQFVEKRFHGSVLTSFSEEHMIAVEYREETHYRWPSEAKIPYKEFERLRAEDNQIEKICIQNNICLIVIVFSLEPKEIAEIIYCKLLDSVPFFDVDLIVQN